MEAQNAMPNALKAIVAGHICLDILPDLEPLSGSGLQSVLKPGSLLQIGTMQFAGGGPVFNTGLALKRLGIPVGLIAKVGEDPLGSILRGILQEKDPVLLNGVITDPHGVTSYSIILSNRSTDRIFLHCTGANDTFGPEDIDFSLVEKADLFHFGYPPALQRMYQKDGREFRQVMCSAKKTGATTSLDFALPDPNSESGKVDWQPIYRAVLPYVDIFLPSLDELLFTLRRKEFESISSARDILARATPALLEDLSGELMQMGVKIVMIKLGARGAYLRTASAAALRTAGRAQPSPAADWADRERWIPCFRADVVGTTGAGDSTIAGFLAGLLRGRSMEEAMVMAAGVGACNVEAVDSLSGVKSWDDTRERIRAGWEQLTLAIDEGGWEWEQSSRMWIGPREASQPNKAVGS